MSSPFKHDPPTINGAITEIISGISALNMQPDPITNIPNDSMGFLSETDAWVKHSIEHFRAAIQVLREVEKLQNQNVR